MIPYATLISFVVIMKFQGSVPQLRQFLNRLQSSISCHIQEHEMYKNNENKKASKMS